MAFITPSESKGDRPLDLSLAIGGNTPTTDKSLNTDLSINRHKIETYLILCVINIEFIFGQSC